MATLSAKCDFVKGQKFCDRFGGNRVSGCGQKQGLVQLILALFVWCRVRDRQDG